MNVSDSHADIEAQFDVDDCEEWCGMYAHDDVKHVAAVVAVKPKSSWVARCICDAYQKQSLGSLQRGDIDVAKVVTLLEIPAETIFGLQPILIQYVWKPLHLAMKEVGVAVLILL